MLLKGIQKTWDRILFSVAEVFDYLSPNYRIKPTS